MVGDARSREEFLLLSFFCQNVVGALLDFVEDDKNPGNELAEAILSLENSSEEQLKGILGSKNAFQSFEQFNTLLKVWPEPTERKAVVRQLRIVQDESEKSAARKSAAKRLIQQFTQLQHHALASFNQPEISAPKGFRALCQPT